MNVSCMRNTNMRKTCSCCFRLYCNNDIKRSTFTIEKPLCKPSSSRPLNPTTQSFVEKCFQNSFSAHVTDSVIFTLGQLSITCFHGIKEYQTALQLFIGLNQLFNRMHFSDSLWNKLIPVFGEVLTDVRAITASCTKHIESIRHHSDLTQQ